MNSDSSNAAPRSVQLVLDDMAYNGAAVGRYHGKAVFVPGGIPGEEVLAEIVEERRRYSLARLVRVLVPSPERVAPPCEHFGLCGGCQWQHIAYDAQLRYKEKIVRDQLERIGGIPEPPVRPVIGMADPWGYRNNMQFVVDEEGRLCLLAMGTNRPVPVGQCRLLCPELAEVAAELELQFPGLERVVLRAGRHTGERMIVLEATGHDLPELEMDRSLSCVLLRPDGTGVALAGSTHYHEELGGRRLRVSAGSFFQVNTEQAEQLVRLVRQYAGAEPATPGSEAGRAESAWRCPVILDAYGGVGAFGLALASGAEHVFIIEANPDAAADARANAADVPNVTVIEGDVEEALAELEETIDIAVVDPPRAGVAPKALAGLVARRPGRIIYVSCDPGSLARDLRALLGHGYRLEVVQPVDLFPHTHHVETVSLIVSDGGR
ncbi:MAG: 23S rRNA (uracil(1939)-C(5))-methyltransferase RlmD [Anaerolineae bacterium]|nr:23S rRNA (uracil(1939)-C(5))-methyltransferase RlmD [Anaerolineae bacterium]